jgi:hypothetical protein
MLQITINTADAALLREILEARLLEMRRERWHTDTRAFKEILRERELALTRLVDQLPSAAA